MLIGVFEPHVEVLLRTVGHRYINVIKELLEKVILTLAPVRIRTWH